MQSYLKSTGINKNVTPDAVKNTFKLVENIFRYDKSQPYQNYCCIVIVRNSHLKKYGLRLLFTKDNNNELIRHACLCNAATVPQQLLDDASNSNRIFTHFLVDRKLFYNGQEEVKIIIQPEQQQLGYFSNRSILSKKGVCFLEGKEFISLRRKMLFKLHMIAMRFQIVAQMLHLPIANQKNAA